MATTKTREKRRAARMRKAEQAILKAKDQAEIIEEDPDYVEEDDEIIEKADDLGTDSVTKELVEKDMYPEVAIMAPGPTSWDEYDAEQKAREKAEQINEVSWTTQSLVRNILNSFSMAPGAKASAIKAVGDGFEKRLKSTEKIEKEYDMDLLQAEALIASDDRNTPIWEKFGEWISKKKLTSAAESALSDSDFAVVREEGGKKLRKYPIHDKSHVRNALARAAQMIKRGGEAAKDARAALSKIHAAAKRMGIGMTEKASSSVVVEKDNTGTWRAIMIPSNNFIDTDRDIISEKAHLEYVDWVNKNMDVAPVFICRHIPGTRREHKVDFVGYESGFLVMSAPLTEKEAAGLFRAQAITDLGMSHGTIVLERSKEDPRVVEKYRMVEVSDLPLENAANPFTDLQTLQKEADMDVKKYLATILDSEEDAEKYLSKMTEKQEALRKNGVEEKESKPEIPETPAPKPEAKAEAKLDPAMIEAIAKEFGISELGQYIAGMKAEIEKVPVLEALVKELAAGQDEKLAEKINPPAALVLPWLSTRPSQSKETILKKDNEEDEKLVKAQPVHWLLEAAGVDPVDA